MLEALQCIVYVLFCNKLFFMNFNILVYRNITLYEVRLQIACCDVRDMNNK